MLSLRWLTKCTMYTLAAVVCSATAIDAGAIEGAMTVHPSRPPVMLDLSLAEIEGRFSDRAVDRIVEAASDHPDRVVTVRVPGLFPASRTVMSDERQSRIAAILEATLREARESSPDGLFSIYGLPVEGSSEPKRRATNDRFDAVIAQMDVVVSARSQIASGSGLDEYAAWAAGSPEAVARLDGRPVLFRTNGVWRIATQRTDSPRRHVSPGIKRSGVQGALTRAEPEIVADKLIAGAERGSRSAGITVPRERVSAEVIENENVRVPQRSLEQPLRIANHSDDDIEIRVLPVNLDSSDIQTNQQEEEREGGGPFVVPGAGWVGPTEEPRPVGQPNRHGYTARVIARWDVVPYQTIEDELSLGVVAFHVVDIDRVEFSVNDGPWVTATEMTLNDRTNVWEYVATIRAADFESDQLAEVRAIAYPTVGRPRVLNPLPLYIQRTARERPVVYVSGTGSDTVGVGTRSRPYRNLWRAAAHLNESSAEFPGDDAIIRCLEGDYQWFRPRRTNAAATQNRWLTIEAAEGVDRRDVRIMKHDDARSGISSKLIQFHNVTFAGEPHSLTTSTGRERYLWIHGCRFEAEGLFWTVGWYDGVYVTDSVGRDVTQHLLLACDLVRNCEIDGFAGDAFKASRCVINCTLRNQVGSENDLHSDIWQNSAGYNDNIVLYGITAVDGMDEQGFFSRTGSHEDFAIVNCRIEMQGYPSQHQWRTRSNHMVVRYNTLLGTPLQLALSDSLEDVSGFYGSENCVFEKNVFQWVTISDTEGVSGSDDPGYHDIHPGARFISNHFMNVWPEYSDRSGRTIGEPMGSDATTGRRVPSGRGAYGQVPPPWVEPGGRDL